MPEDLNDLEKIGLAFLSGLIAGSSLEKASDEDEEKQEEVKNKKVVVGKIEGTSAEEFINMIENMGKKLGGK